MRAILQNSWLSEVFREQALNKVISCALKVRRATAKVTKKSSSLKILKYYFVLASRWIFNNIFNINRRYDTNFCLGNSWT
jgi:hypothetical protein